MPAPKEGIAKAGLEVTLSPTSKLVPASVHVTSVLHRLAKGHANSAKIVETPCNTEVTCPKGAIIKIQRFQEVMVHPERFERPTLRFVV